MNRNCSSIRCCVCSSSFRYHNSALSLIWQHSEILIQKKCHRIRKLKIKWKLIIILGALQVLRVRSPHLFMSSFYSLNTVQNIVCYKLVLPSLPKSCATNTNSVWTNTRFGWLYWNLNSTISRVIQRVSFVCKSCHPWGTAITTSQAIYISTACVCLLVHI